MKSFEALALEVSADKIEKIDDMEKKLEEKIKNLIVLTLEKKITEWNGNYGSEEEKVKEGSRALSGNLYR